MRHAEVVEAAQHLVRDFLEAILGDGADRVEQVLQRARVHELAYDRDAALGREPLGVEDLDEVLVLLEPLPAVEPLLEHFGERVGDDVMYRRFA